MCPVILADRGFARASLLEWLHARRLDDVIRIDKGTCLTEPGGRRWKLGQARWAPGVRYGLYHGRPRELVLNDALCWQAPKRPPPPAPVGHPARSVAPGCSWRAALSQWGRASLITLALALLDDHGDLPPACLPAPT
jgi:hypothetical protein